MGCAAKPATEVGKKVDALDASAWGASKWISAVDAPVVKERKGDRAADGASWFVSTIKNDQKVVSAKWMTSGLGVYELYVNGQRVGSEFLKPGFTDVRKTRRSFTYDITDAFKTGAKAENMLAAQVTPGWWADKIVTPRGNEGMRGRKCAFRGVLELTFEDGSRQLYGTDTLTWNAGIAGPVKHAAIYDGEEYDARDESGYMSLEKSGVPEINNEFCGEILPSSGAEVYLLEEENPYKAKGGRPAHSGREMKLNAVVSEIDLRGMNGDEAWFKESCFAGLATEREFFVQCALDAEVDTDKGPETKCDTEGFKEV